MKATNYVSVDKTLSKSAIPFVDNFPKNIILPDYIFKNLRAYGNTVISNKLAKKLGWNGIQWYCARQGLKVTVVKTSFNNVIVEVFGREKN